MEWVKRQCPVRQEAQRGSERRVYAAATEQVWPTHSMYSAEKLSAVFVPLKSRESRAIG